MNINKGPVCMYKLISFICIKGNCCSVYCFFFFFFKSDEKCFNEKKVKIVQKLN